MNYFKKPFLVVVGLLSLSLWGTSCSKNDDPAPMIDPNENSVTLTQLNASVGEPTATTRATNEGTPNVMKTAFAGGDFFSLSYNAYEVGEQMVYAHTIDGKTWTFRKTGDASSAVQSVALATTNTALKAAYLPVAAAGTADGIVLEDGNMLACYDALTALGSATVSGESATASLNFTHVNHLLRFSVSGDASATDISYVLLTVSYKDAAGKQQTALLKTTLRTEYTAAGGAKIPVVQAIVPREALLKGITVMFSSGKLLVANDPDHSPANLACPGGKSRLIPLIVQGDQLTMQPSDISAGWADGGTLNSDEKLADAIYIGTAEQLKAFRNAVNSDPATDLAKIDGVLAYTANVVQTANIDLEDDSWTPIGGAVYNDDNRTYFAGTYNGNGYTISNMTVTAPSGNGASHYAGLFGWVKSPRDKNVVLVGIHLRNASVKFDLNNNYTLYLGMLVGRIDGDAAYPTVVSLCSATGDVTTNSSDQIDMGGLVGSAEKAHITRCTVNVSTTATGNAKTSVGGVVGNARNSYIVSCYARGDVKIMANGNATRAYAGGIVGNVDDNSGDNSLIMACRADGSVDAGGQEVNAGGLVGSGIGTLSGSFAKGTVTGNASGTGRVGAIIGDFPSQIYLCYGTSANGKGTSNLSPESGNISYKSNPEAGEIMALMSASGRPGSTANRILTVVNPFVSGLYTTRVESRLWSLSGLFDEPWSDTVPGGDSVYPVPVMSYAGQQF